MTVINPITFQGMAIAENGKVYNKTNAGKNIGTAIGIGAGYSALLLPEVALSIASLSTRVSSLKYLSACARGLQAGFVLLAAAAGRLLGGIPDAIVNNSRAKKAKNFVI